MDTQDGRYAYQVSLSRRFSLILTGVVTAIVVLFSGIMIYLNVSESNRRLNAQVARMAHVAETSLVSAMWELDPLAIESILNALCADETIVYARVVTLDNLQVVKAHPDFSQRSMAFFQNSPQFTTRHVPILKNRNPIGSFDLVISRRSQLYYYVLSSLSLTLLLMLVCSLTPLLLVRRYILIPLAALLDAAAALSDGKLDLPLLADPSGARRDEIGELQRVFDGLRLRLQSLLEHLRRAGTLLQSSSEEILMAVSRIAAALEEQSASVSETTAMMESVTASSRRISGNTDAVATMAGQTGACAQKGVAMAETAIAGMQNIHETNTRVLQKIMILGTRSEKIGDIIELINDIADRTKLIAFNAALEAVNSGEAGGKRFNIVAMEIRRLADSIIESTEEISANILEIQQGIQELVVSSDSTTLRIHEGMTQTAALADSLQEILGAASRTTDEAKQIASSTSEQQQAHEQILLALKEISDNTRQFVNAGNQASMSVDEMKTLADKLHHLITSFGQTTE